jgi:REP element-mobilizing transposase RayT
VHITLSVDPNLPSLRRPDLTECIEDCLREIPDARTDFRVVHYSIQRHHLHLVVEAANRQALSRGMRGLAIRVARRINKVLGRAQAAREKLRPFGAVQLSWLFGNNRVRRERRAALRAGIRDRHAVTGLWQLCLHFLVGNDVGIERDEDVVQLGGGIGWSP